MPDAAQFPLHVLKLILDVLKSFTLLGSHAVRLLVDDLYEGADVGVGEDVGTYLADDQLLETAGVEPGSIAGVLAVFMDYGQAWATIDSESVVTIVVFGEDQPPPLLRAYTLEGPALAVDPEAQRLVPTHLILY